jgi:hypothetical protein
VNLFFEEMSDEYLFQGLLHFLCGKVMPAPGKYRESVFCYQSARNRVGNIVAEQLTVLLALQCTAWQYKVLSVVHH